MQHQRVLRITHYGVMTIFLIHRYEQYFVLPIRIYFFIYLLWFALKIVDFVDSWLLERFPQVRRWQYDDNSGERSILLFHVHVFIEMDPFSFTPRPDMEYFPPHMV